MMDKLAQLGYIDYELNPKTKKLTYQIKDWVVQCSGEPCMGSEAIYATHGYGFLCLPRNITQRLVEAHYHFDESDAWLDLWCHTVWQELFRSKQASKELKQQCVLSYGACYPVRQVWRRFDLGNSWPPLGMGEDEGLALFQKARGCLPAAKAARLLRLPDLQHRLPSRNLFYSAGVSTS